MTSTCILFSAVLLILADISGCSQALKGDDMREREKRQLNIGQALLICPPRGDVPCKQDDGSFSCCCFPSMAKVKLQNGKSVSMTELQIGDRVQTVSPEGKLHYNEVRAFLTKDESVTSWCRSITTSSNSTIQLTNSHLIYTRKSSGDKFTAMCADKISTGDDVLINRNSGLSSEKVTYVRSFTMQGAFSPLTEYGNIVVGGVLASCYASFDHDLAHLAMIPMQWCPEIIEWIFGVNNGTPEYVNIAKGFGRWMMPSALLGKSG